MSTNEQTRKEKTAAVETLHAEIDELSASIAKLTQEITDLTAEIAEIDKAVAEATAVRETEKEKARAWRTRESPHGPCTHIAARAAGHRSRAAGQVIEGG